MPPRNAEAYVPRLPAGLPELSPEALRLSRESCRRPLNILEQELVSKEILRVEAALRIARAQWEKKHGPVVVEPPTEP